MDMRKMNKVTLSMGLAFGGAAGYVLAHLYAPMSGDAFEQKLELEAKKLKLKALLKADDLINSLNYQIDRQISKEEARRLNDLRKDMADQLSRPSIKVDVDYDNEAVIEIDNRDLSI